jgi:hypothetical protein
MVSVNPVNVTSPPPVRSDRPVEPRTAPAQTGEPRPTPPPVQPPVVRRPEPRAETSVSSAIGTNVDIRA